MMRVRLVVAVAVALVVVSVAVAAGAGVTTVDASGVVVLDGQKTFPIVLAKGPPPDGTTPSGGNAFAEVVGAGVNFLKVGPATVPWTAADIDEAKLEDQAAAAQGAHTWVNLATLSRATPGSAADGLLSQVVTSLEQDPSGSAIGMWKGADEPWWSGIAPTALQFVYCRATGRGDASWCGGESALDQDHLWVTVQAPRGTSADLAPYAAVSDVHGVDVYPVTAANPTPDLHEVGSWTSTIAAVTPSHAVWTTLQICASGSVRADGSFVLPTREQERFMIYDAIINGARNLAFYGGNNPDCWNATDAQHSWSWTFWNTTLRSLITEIGSSSPLAPALVNPASNTVLSTSDTTTEVVRRAGNSGELWVLAARSGAGTQAVTISGLPGRGGQRDRLHRRTLSPSRRRLADRQLRPVGSARLPPRRASGTTAGADNRLDRADQRPCGNTRHDRRRQSRRRNPRDVRWRLGRLHPCFGLRALRDRSRVRRHRADQRGHLRRHSHEHRNIHGRREHASAAVRRRGWKFRRRSRPARSARRPCRQSAVSRPRRDR